MTTPKQLTTHGLLLLSLAELLLALLVKVLLLRLGIQSLEIGITLRLLSLLLLSSALLSILLLNDTFDLGNLGITHGAHLLEHLGTEVGIADQLVRQTDKVLEQGGELIVVVVRREVVLEEDALAGDGLVEGQGLVAGLVADDEVVEVVAGGGDDLGELVGEEGVGDLGALAHDGQPVGELGVFLGGSEGDVVAVVAELLHGRLVDDSPDEVVIRALLVLDGVFGGGTAADGDGKALFAVKGVQDSFGNVFGRAEQVAEDAQDGLGDIEDGVEALGEGQVDVEESNVLAARGVRRELVQRLLAQVRVRVLPLGVGSLVEADLGELVLECRRVGAQPRLALGAVGLGSNDVEHKDDAHDEDDESLRLELGDGVALVHVIPFRPWHASYFGTCSGEGVSIGSSFGDWVGSGGKVGKV